MRVLLDECAPRKLRNELPGHEVRTVQEMGWAGVENGALLRLAAERFDVLLTTDQNVEHQQNLEDFDLAVVVLHAIRNDIDLLKPLMPRVRETLTRVRPGELWNIGI